VLTKTPLVLNGSVWETNPAVTFTESGTYEVYYFVRDKDTKKLSPMKRSVVYKDKPGNNAPDAFNLTSPSDGSVRTTMPLLRWEETADPDGDPVTYTVMISQDSSFATVDYMKEEIGHNAVAIDSEAGLQDLTTYYWKVAAVDSYGKKTESNQVWSFDTDDTNALPGYIWGYITDVSTGTGIEGAIAKRDSNNDQDDARSDGYYIFSTAAGTDISITASVGGYNPLTKVVLSLDEGGSKRLNFKLVSLNTPPAADAGGPYSGTEGQSIVLDGSSSTDTDGSITTYEWDVDNNGTYDYTSSSPTQGHTYAQNGTYTVKLRVTDNNGATNTSTAAVTISDTVPTAGFTGSPASGTAPQTVDFTSSSAGYDVPLTYAWDFDNDGSVDSTSANPSAVYYAGTYTVKLTVTDSDGSVDALTNTDYISVCYSDVSIGSTGTYTSLQGAYAAAADPETIEGRDVTITESVDLNRPITVTIRGGYNCDHSQVTGKTIINGNMTISDGTVTMENVQVQ